MELSSKTRELLAGEAAVRDAEAGYFFIDAGGSFRWVNNAWLRMHGYASAAEVVGRDFSVTQVESDLGRARDVVRQVLAGVPIPAGEFTRKCKDGSVGYHTFTAHPVREGDRIVGLEGFLIDTTAVHQLEARYEMLFNRMLDGFALHEMIFDPEGKPVDYRFLSVNPAFERMTGLSPEAILGKTVREVLPNTESTWIENYGRVVLTGEPYRFESFHAGLGRHFEVVAFRPQNGQFACIVRNITERKRSEDLLRESEERFRQIVTRAGEGIALVDAEERFQFVNPAAEAIFGVPPHGLVGRSLREFLTPEGFQRVLRETAKRRGAEDSSYELELLRPDGATRQILVTAVPSATQEGQFKGSFGIFRDITERKRAEAALRESEERYRLLVEASGEAIFSGAADGTIDSANPEACRIFGCGEDEFRRIGRAGLIDPNDPRLAAALAERERTGRWKGELSFLRRDGTTFPAEVSSAVFKDSAGRSRTSIIIRDITERKQAEDELRESEARFRELAELLPEAIFEMDLRGTLTFVNHKAFDCFGYEPEDALRGLHAWDMVADEDRDRARGSIQKVLGGETIGLTEYTAKRKDGSTFPILLQSMVVLRRGEPVGLRGFIIDITERKQAEAKLMQAQKMESVGRLAGGVAHDFNNLLTVINGYSRLALGKLNARDPLRDSLAEIHRAGERAAGLTQQLLAFSRRQVLQPRVLDFNHVLSEMRPMLARLLGEDVELRVELHAQAPTICADPHQLEQVVMNLAVNSRDAMPDGGKLSIETAVVEWGERQTQSHPGAPVGPYVMLAVSDSGVGMNEETRRRIFEPFFTTKEVGKGTGLGLAMIQGIVEQSGGFIEVDSEPGCGATFRIYLPRVEGTPADCGKPEAVPAGGGKETVLVVEDQAEVRKYAAAALRDYGYRVIQAESGAEALLLCEREGDGVDLVLTDVVMPNMSGGELKNRLGERWPGIKVLFMSGYTDDAIMQHGVLTKGAKFLQKPFSPDQLAIKVREILAAPDGPARILVADDEAGVRSFLRTALEDAGYEVMEAADGKQALKKARTGRVDLLVTDLVMPEREGIETIQALRRDGAGIGIIAISGGALGGQYLEMARKLGADVVLSKPVSADLLLTKVAEVLKLRQVPAVPHSECRSAVGRLK